MFINETGVIGQILSSGTQTVTGSLFITLLMVLLFFLIVCIMFSIPIEFASILILPICIATASYYSDFLGPLGVILIYISMIIAKNWIFR